MKSNQFKKNTMYLLLLTLLLSTSTFAQLICKVVKKELFHEPSPREELSGLAYHPKEKIYFMPADNPLRINLPELVFFEAYNPFATDEEKIDFNVPFTDLSIFGDGLDFEGITHLKDHYFALLEEDENKIYFLEYLPDDSDTPDYDPKFKVLSGHETGIPITLNGDPDFNSGLEGISYDPHSGRLFVVEEIDDIRLFSFPITLPGADIEEGIDVSKITSVSLQNIIEKDASGLFHLGQIYPANSALSNNILVVSKFSDKMWEIDISFDGENNLSVNEKKEVRIGSAGDPLKYTGVTVVDNTIYIVTEGNSSILYQYNIKSINDSCDDDDKIYDQDCECMEKPACKTVYNIPKNFPGESFLKTFYESSQSIVTEVNDGPGINVVIRENEAVDLKSDHIILNEGFKVENGACLNATIEPCE